MISDEKKTLNVFIIIFIKLRFRNLIILIVNKKLVELSIFEFLLFAFFLYLLLISVINNLHDNTDSIYNMCIHVSK